MALAIDASSPALFNLADPSIFDDPTGTSASFTPPNGSLLVVALMCDTAPGVTPTPTISGGGWTYTNRVLRGDAEGTAAVAAIFTAPVTTGASMTVTVNVPNIGVNHGAGVNCGSAKVWVVTGQHASPIGATAEASNSSNNNWTATGPTTTAANSMVFASASEWNARGAPTSSDLTEDAAHFAGLVSGLHGYKSVASAGATTLNLDAGGTAAPDWNMVSLEILEAAGGGGTNPKGPLGNPFAGPFGGPI